MTTPEGTCLLGHQPADRARPARRAERRARDRPDLPGASSGRAEEVFITSTAGGILPVTRIDHQPVGDGHPGPVSTRLQNLYWQRHDEGWQSTPIDYE